MSDNGTNAHDQKNAPHSNGLLATLSVATLIQIVATASVLALTAIAPKVAADLGIGAYWIGYQISLIYAAGTLSSAVAGTLVQRFGPVRIEQGALVCFFLGFIGIASANIALTILASLLIGWGYGLNNPASSELLGRITPQAKRNLVFSIKQAGVPFGGILASFTFPYLARFMDWRYGLLIGAIAPMVTFVLLSMLHNGEVKNPIGQRRSLLRGLMDEQALIWGNAKLLTLSWLGFAYSATQLSLSAFAVVTLVHDAGWPLLAAGSVAAAMQFAGTFGRIFWGIVADRIGGGFKTLSLLGAVNGIGFCALFWVMNMPVFVQVITFVILGATTIGWNGVLLAEVAHNAPQGRIGAITGGVLVYTFIGVIIGPSSFASLSMFTGHYGTSFIFFSVLGFFGMVFAWRAHKIQRIA